MQYRVSFLQYPLRDGFYYRNYVIFDLVFEVFSLIKNINRSATRKGWNDSIKCVADGKAALKEILDELEKLSSWDI